MTWSAAKEPRTAPGWRRSSTAAARPIAAIESRGEGSASRFACLRSGSCVRTASWCSTPVTTMTWSPHSGTSRSHVDCSSERPVPVRSCRNFGAEARDTGQSRVPAPPAGITAQKSSTEEAEAGDASYMAPTVDHRCAPFCALKPFPYGMGGEELLTRAAPTARADPVRHYDVDDPDGAVRVLAHDQAAVPRLHERDAQCPKLPARCTAAVKACGRGSPTASAVC